jgi:hypothetical protein
MEALIDFFAQLANAKTVYSREFNDAYRVLHTSSQLGRSRKYTHDENALSGRTRIVNALRKQGMLAPGASCPWRSAMRILKLMDLIVVEPSKISRIKLDTPLLALQSRVFKLIDENKLCGGARALKPLGAKYINGARKRHPRKQLFPQRSPSPS